MATYLPEGYLSVPPVCLKNLAAAEEAMSCKKIIEARALVCDANHNLIVDLGCIKGIIPREECAIGTVSYTHLRPGRDTNQPGRLAPLP